MVFEIRRSFSDSQYKTLIEYVKKYSVVFVLRDVSLSEPVQQIVKLAVHSNGVGDARNECHIECDVVFGQYALDDIGLGRKKELCNSLKDELTTKFTITGDGLSSYRIGRDEYAYNVATTGLNRTSHDLRLQFRTLDTVIEKDVLVKDLSFSFDILETVINKAYCLASKEVKYDILPRIDCPAKKHECAAMELGVDEEDLLEHILVKPEDINITYDSVGGCVAAKKELRRVKYMFLNPAILKQWGARQPKGILLYGPPGTGKTLLARATAKEISANFFSVACSDIVDKWYGNSEKRMAKVFEIARGCAPAIIFIDEIDALALSRERAYEATARIVGVLLKEMDGMNDLNNVMVIGATNKLSAIDTALLRPGRFDKKIEIPLPDVTAREDIYKILLSKTIVCKDISFSSLSKNSDTLSGADISGIINLVLDNKIDMIMRDETANPISTEDVLDAIKNYQAKLKHVQGVKANDNGNDTFRYIG